MSGYTCGPAGTCVLLGNGGQGTPCVSGDGSALHPCDAGLYCPSTTRMCTPKVAANGPCTNDVTCQSGSCDMASAETATARIER